MGHAFDPVCVCMGEGNDMKNYVKPVVLDNEEVFEGVYAASGDCYTVTTSMHQEPQEGRIDYRIQVNGTHNAADDHHSGEQVLTLSFNMPVSYVSSNGSLIAGDGTSSIQIRYSYHNNGVDNIGLGDVVVSSSDGLGITGAVLSCNYDCGQH